MAGLSTRLQCAPSSFRRVIVLGEMPVGMRTLPNNYLRPRPKILSTKRHFVRVGKLMVHVKGVIIAFMPMVKKIFVSI